MAEISKFPFDRQPPPGQRAPAYVSVGLAAASVVLAVSVAATVSGWIMGSFVAGEKAQMASLLTLWDSDHKEMSAHLKLMMGDIKNLSAQESAQAREIVSIRDMLSREKQDRLESERRILEYRR